MRSVEPAAASAVAYKLIYTPIYNVYITSEKVTTNRVTVEKKIINKYNIYLYNIIWYFFFFILWLGVRVQKSSLRLYYILYNI